MFPQDVPVRYCRLVFVSVDNELAIICSPFRREACVIPLSIEAQASVTRRHKQFLLPNAFTIAHVGVASSPRVTGERWAFERNER